MWHHKVAGRGGNLDHAQLGSGNPHLLVTPLTRTADAAHVCDGLAPVDSPPRSLRSTGLLNLSDELDAKVLTAALGSSYAGSPHCRPNPDSGRSM